MNQSPINFLPHGRKEQYKCAVVACTGMAGQQFLEALDLHPWFRITGLYAHTQTGLPFKQVRRGLSAKNLSSHITKMIVQSVDDIDLENVDLIFSAVPGNQAEKLEAKFAEKIPVISTASFYRYQEDVPILLPMINGNHAEIIPIQKKNRGWKGFICPGPNCTTVGAAIALFPIYQAFGLDSIHLVSMQAISGAGYPGVPAYDIIGNIIPHIPNEEKKVASELQKIFGMIKENRIVSTAIPIDAKCNRVPVIDGHMESIFFQTRRPTNVLEIQKLLKNFRGDLATFTLPSNTKFPISVFDHKFDPFRPQPRLEFDNIDPFRGMKTYVGGIERSCFQNGFKMTILSHNTQLGAGKGGVLSAEYLAVKGYF